MNLLASLRYLVALSEHRHFGRAAEACHITQPALSNAMRALESEFGVVIVKRGRSYAGLMRVLTASTRAAIEQDLRSLVEGLERPETLHVEVSGDSATVGVPGGHSVKLKRDGGVWRVEDFD